MAAAPRATVELQVGTYGACRRMTLVQRLHWVILAVTARPQIGGLSAGTCGVGPAEWQGRQGLFKLSNSNKTVLAKGSSNHSPHFCVNGLS
jgi:hypothetical protein